MNFLKRLLVGVGGFALAAMLLAMLAPKAAHAVVSTMVTVVNAPSQPVFTVATDNPALQPFQFTANGDFVDFSFTVPSGKTLVMEQVMVACISNGTTLTTFPTDFRLFTTAGGTPASYIFAPTVFSTLELVVNQVTRLYADPQTTVFIGEGGGVPAGTSCGVSVSGHLVSAP